MIDEAPALRTTVAIVGGGPVGLVLATLLGKRGVAVTVIDRASDVFPLPRAAHMDHTVLRVMQEIGALDEVLPGTVVNSALVLADENLDPLVTIPATGIRKSGFPASMYFYQPAFDRTLESFARRQPSVEVRRGVEMLDHRQDDDRVTVRCRDDHGAEFDLIADWMVASDGAGSPTRESWGVPLDSLDFDERWLVVDIVLPDDAPDVPDYALQVCDPVRPWVSNPVPGGRYRAELRIHDGDDIAAMVNPAFIRQFLRPLLGEADFSIDRDAVYTFHGLVAQEWRRGRVMLAGDAAHQMPPFLGQGMVSGIRDAVNLAWKLAGVIEGRFAPQILDSYQQEREPHVRSIIDSAISVGRFVSLTDAQVVRARNAALRAGDTTAVPRFSIPVLAPGDLVLAGGGDIFPQPARPGEYPGLDEQLGEWFSIVSLGPLPADQVAWWVENFAARVVQVDDLGVDADAVRAWLQKEQTPVVIVRPDRLVMAAGDSLDEITREAENRSFSVSLRNIC